MEVMVCEYQLAELAVLNAENPKVLFKALVVAPISSQIHFGPGLALKHYCCGNIQLIVL